MFSNVEAVEKYSKQVYALTSETWIWFYFTSISQQTNQGVGGGGNKSKSTLSKLIKVEAYFATFLKINDRETYFNVVYYL